jgi:hypothetical protein
MTLKPVPYRTQEEIETLVRAFEEGSLSPAAFNHHAHMTVALWYLMRLPYPDAVAHLRAQIRKFAARHHQSQLYNETITLFWMKLLRHLLDRAEPVTPVADTVYQILAAWGSMLFVFKHYSKELVFSEKAKQAWVEPDLRPLGFEI